MNVYIRITEELRGYNKGDMKFRVFTTNKKALDSINKDGCDNCYWRRTYINTVELEEEE